MKNIATFINTVLTSLESKDLLKGIDNTAVFYDEPKYFFYSAAINTQATYFHNYFVANRISAGGVSFSSRYEALLKCLGELTDRLGTYSYQQKLIEYKHTFHDALNPSLYTPLRDFKTTTFGWIRGTNLTTQKPSYIPAQLVYINYARGKEPRLTTTSTTGAAGGFDSQSALIRGIYEIVEVDACMTTYLNQISLPKIDLTIIQEKTIKNILNGIQRYALELYCYDMTHDFGISTFLSIIIDRTGIGPAVSAGTKANLNSLKAIIGSIEEACMKRAVTRNLLMKQPQQTPFKTAIMTKEDRAMFWANPAMIKAIDFLLRQKPVPFYFKPFIKTPQEEFSFLVQTLSKKGYCIYSADITHDFIKKLGYTVQKVLIPGLQPWYVNENKKELNMMRLISVAKYFHKKNFYFNTIPHPF